MLNILQIDLTENDREIESLKSSIIELQKDLDFRLRIKNMSNSSKSKVEPNHSLSDLVHTVFDNTNYKLDKKNPSPEDGITNIIMGWLRTEKYLTANQLINKYAELIDESITVVGGRVYNTLSRLKKAGKVINENKGKEKIWRIK